jgi:hypothetical protein
VLFWAAEWCGILRLRREPGRWRRALFAAAAAGGLGLIILSQSGHAAVTLAAVLVFAAVWFVRRRATPGAYLAIVFAIGVVLPVLIWFAIESLSSRIGGASEMGNSSWGDRSASLVIGLRLWLADVPTLLFGTGVGLTSPALQRDAGLEAVWSVLLTYVYETGFIGLIAVAYVGQHLVRAWRANGRGLAFAAVFTVWLVGVTVTTSYQQLLPLWLTLGWLCAWPAICRKSGESAPVARSVDRMGEDEPSRQGREVQTSRERGLESEAPLGRTTIEMDDSAPARERERAGAAAAAHGVPRRASRWHPGQPT